MKRIVVLFMRVVALVVLALSLTNCFLDRSGTGPGVLPITLDVRPLYLCEREPVHLSWEYPSPIPSGSILGLVLTRRPGGVLEIPHPGASHPATGSFSFTPRQPSLPEDVAETAITFTAHLSDASRLVGLNTQTATAIVIGSAATIPDFMVFEWGCDNAAGGGAGWSRVDYERLERTSANVRITAVRNLSPFSIHLGVGSRGSTPPFDRTLGVGQSTSDFNGELYGAWGAAPEALDFFGPNGCEEGAEPGTIVIGEGGEPAIVLPRPEVRIELQLTCQIF